MYRPGIIAAATLLLAVAHVSPQQPQHSLRVRVTHDAAPIARAAVEVDSAVLLTDVRGDARFAVAAGPHVIRVRELGFAAESTIIMLTSDTLVMIAIREQALESEALVATATRTGTLIRDQPIRVEALPQEEIEENLTIQPGNLTTLLNELAGLHVQITSAGSSATALRIRGFPGSLTQILVDGLPLLGPDGNGFGLLQTPPLDLGRVEVIKGVASALYGGSALGGVVNLVSRPPGGDPTALLNRTSRGGTDATAFMSGYLRPSVGYSVIGGLSQQDRVDADGDGWADLTGYRRATVRPRIFLEFAPGQSAFLTAGYVTEKRNGGTLAGRTTPDAGSFAESVNTERADAGVNAHFILARRFILGVRGSFTHDTQNRSFGGRNEADTRMVSFAEASLVGSSGSDTWVTGVAIDSDRLRVDSAPQAAYSYSTPALFVQNEYAIAHWIVVSASARVDAHNMYGTYGSPRVSMLVRPIRNVTARASAGTGFAAPTPLTDETAATGITVLEPLSSLRSERARAVSFDLNWRRTPFEVDASVFTSRLRDALDVKRSLSDSNMIALYNEQFARATTGTEFVTRYSHGLLHVIGSYTFLHTRQGAPGNRVDAELVPRHAAEIGAIIESETRGRMGVEVSYSGRARLRDRIYSEYSRPYVEVNALAEFKFLGDNGLFINGIDLTNVRQTDYFPLLRPSPGVGGRRTTDVWAPLVGRTFNAGLRLEL